ncbi:hypothetical protein JCM5296_001118 [Sporobolomyces johnsonii]
MRIWRGAMESGPKSTQWRRLWRRRTQRTPGAGCRRLSPAPLVVTAFLYPPFKLAGFGDDDGADFGDLLNTSSSIFGASSTYSAYPADQEDDDLSTNPFADMTSSSAQLSYPSATQQSFHRESDPSDVTYSSALYGTPQTPATPAFQAARSFDREGAPEPETPAFVRAATEDHPSHDYSAYTTASAPVSTAYDAPISPTRQTPFGSPPTSPSAVLYPNPAAEPQSLTHVRLPSKPDISALLGEEKPILPSFKRAERSEGVAGPLGSKIAVLPVSSVGRKPVKGALASLLGLEVEEEAPKSSKAAAEAPKESAPAAPTLPANTAAEPPQDREGEHVAFKEEEQPQEEVAEAPEAPLPPEPTSIEPPPPTALETPLPPSPSASPAPPEQPTITTAEPSSVHALSRTPSEAPSTLSTTASSVDVPYESMVSPLDTGVDEDGTRRESAWPANKAVDGLEARLASLNVNQLTHDGDATPSNSTPTGSFVASPAPQSVPPGSHTPSDAALPVASSPPPAAYSRYIFREGPPLSPEPNGHRPSMFETPTSRGFRAFNGSGDEGGFGGTDDGDSLKGTYSRSVEVVDGEDAETETGPSSPATERAIEREGDLSTSRGQREGSAPLPPLPPAIQGSPRSTELGGSLGPSFIITVGDPQKVGNPLNPAAQHTVYTVHTRTTSSAFRKSDFSVLRRFSHFLWLFDALTQNNPGVIVPGMPEKHAIGRFGSEFVENRRLGLQAALMKIVSHPMLVGDPDLRLFLESDTFHIDIKQRKIDSAADNKGFLASISSSISGPKFVEFDDYFEQRRHALDTFETQLRSLLTSVSAAAKARSALQVSTVELQSAFLALSQCDLSTPLRKVLDEAASLQKRLHDLSEAQAVSDEQIGGLVSVAESYARMCTSARGVFGARIRSYHAWQAAESNLRKAQAAHEKAKKSGRAHSELLGLSVAEIAEDGSLRLVCGDQAERKMLDARHDFEDVSKLTKAEMARFDKEKVDDFKKALEDYADSLAMRQREVVAAWQHYHDLVVSAVEANAATPPSPAPVPESPSL